MRKAIGDLDFVLAITLTSNAIAPQRIFAKQVIDQTAPVFATDDFGWLAALTSNLHRVWAMKYATTFGQGFRYSVTQAFRTFPFPAISSEMRAAGIDLDTTRREVMLRRNVGVTSLYGLINDPGATGSDIGELRDQERAIDEAVLHSYSWDDIRLDHGFHTFRQMERFTIGPAARS